jgi:signal transduction histidine kinase
VRAALLPRDVVFAILAALTAVMAWFGFYYDLDPYLRYLWDRPRSSGLVPSSLAVLALLFASRLPAVSLGLTWVVLLSIPVLGLPPQMALLMTVLIGFACSAWGSRWTLWLSGLSIPLATLVVALTFDWRVLYRLMDGWGFSGLSYSLYQSLDWRLIVFLLPQIALWIPWLLGLTWRFRNRSKAATEQTVVAQAERDEATLVAHAREQQAQLARDVHDVVGHSLTVILAQAQAAQYLQDEARVRASLETIVATAQTSLADVRRVLASTAGAPLEAPALEEFHAMLDGVRASGREVLFAEEGQPRPLPPELATVAHRVVQEMVTNAVRHGAVGQPIRVERHWGWDLRLEVTNGVDVPDDSAAQQTQVRRVGQGIEGMRRRLASVGGRLDVRHRSQPATHTVTAWIPLPGTMER